MRTKLHVAWLAAAARLLATSCALKNPPDAAAIKAEAMPKVVVPLTWSAIPSKATIVTDNWLASFHDDQLVAAVNEAITAKTDEIKAYIATKITAASVETAAETLLGNFRQQDWRIKVEFMRDRP